MYHFNRILLERIQQAFTSATLESELVEFSCIEKRDYLYIKFGSPIVASIIHDDGQSILPIIFSGDAELTKRCNQSFDTLGGSVDLSFRWFCSYQETKTITIIGFALKIIYPTNKYITRQAVFERLLQELENAGVTLSSIEYKERMLTSLSLIAEKQSVSTLRQPCFFSESRTPSILHSRQLETVSAYISANIPPVSAHYVRSNELSINPTYQNSESIKCGLAINEKKIWLLRSDFILALGNKNINWTFFNDDGLQTVIEAKLHAYVNWEDRYGHPSLALPHNGYNGSAFYGGYLAQRNGFLELYTFCGRYHRSDLDDRNKGILEAFVVCHLQNAYGDQPVVFTDAEMFGSESKTLDCFELSIFLNNQPLPEYCLRRSYDKERVQSIFESITVSVAGEDNGCKFQ